MSWLDYLQDASWNGVPFGVYDAERTGGRQVAEHGYPFRDEVWPEDMGLAPRRFSIRGFLIGDDCFAQEDAMHAAAAQAGPGLLVHPTLGAITVSLTRFSSRIATEHGRVVELQFGFLRGATSAIFPSAITDALSAISSLADAAALAASGDYGALLASLGAETGIASWLTTSLGISGEVTSQVTSWGAKALSLAGDAGIMTSAVAGLVGDYGRFGRGNRGTLLSSTATIGSVLAGVTTARTLITTGVSDAQTLASLVTG